MRYLRPLSLALTACAVALVFASTASAASPEFSTGSDKFTVSSGPGVLKGALTIKCTKDKSNSAGLIKTTKTITVTIDFESCTVLGIAANSEGDASGVILASGLGELCYIEGSKVGALKVGLLTTVTPNVKILSAGVKSEVKGAVIGEVTPLNTKKIEGKVVYKIPNPKECFTENENKGTAKKHTLEAETGGGAFAKAEEETEESVRYALEIEVKA